MSEEEEIDVVENTLTRQQKRKQQKKDRKKRLRQQIHQITEQSKEENINVSNSVSDILKYEESNRKEPVQVRNPVMCELCHEQKWNFHCLDCDLFLCRDCLEKKHRELLNENINHIHIKERVLIEPTSEKETSEEPIKTNPYSNVVLYDENAINHDIPNESDELDNEFHKKEKQKQHEGLRCKKCFLLLCNDDDFVYGNGAIFTDPQVLHRHHFYNLYQKGKSVFCKNIHCVGRVEHFSYTHKTYPIYRLLMNAITFEENYLHNPKYKDSDIIKNKYLGSKRPVMPSEEKTILW